MRILMLAQSRSAHSERWAKAMVSRGHAVTMLSHYADPITGVQVVPFKVPAWSLRYPQGWFGRYHAFLLSVVRGRQADIVHIHYVECDYRFTKKDFLGRPLVISVWGSDVIIDDEEDADTHARKVALLSEADQLTATTNFLAQKCREYARRPLGHIEVIPFGVETDLFAEAGRDGNKRADVFRIGFVKHLRPKYGPEYLIQALPGIAAKFPNVELVMVGDGPMRRGLFQLAEKLGVSERIRWLGYVPYSHVPAIYASLDVFVMPSAYSSESFGVAAVEAQAAGVAVVASDFPGIREAVQDGVGGILVPPRDSTAIVEAVCGLLADGARRKNMGLAGQKFVQDRYEWADSVDAMQSVYKRLLGLREAML